MEHIYEPTKYPDLLLKINLTSSELINQLKDYKLSFSKVHNAHVEWGMRLPMFAYPFYDYLIKYQHIPNQLEYISYYFEFNKDFFTQHTLDDTTKEGVEARLKRSYPSFVRDVCFNKYVKENIQGYTASYNLDLDIKEGIDLMLSDQSNNFGVCLYTKTKRAFVGRAKKQFRHTEFTNVKYIEYPVDFKGSLQVGDFFLYGEKEFHELLNLIK